jgi:hypothetical protein
MLNADNLLEQIGKWDERMEHQYTKADAQDDVPATAQVARVGLSAIDSFARYLPESEARTAQQADAAEFARSNEGIRASQAAEEAYRAAHPNWQAEVRAERRAMEEWEARGFR